MVIVDIINGNFKAADGADIPWILPGDMFYARFDANGVDDNEDIHTLSTSRGRSIWFTSGRKTNKARTISAPKTI